MFFSTAAANPGTEVRRHVGRNVDRRAGRGCHSGRRQGLVARRRLLFHYTSLSREAGESDIESIKIAITRDSYFVMVTNNEQHKCHSDTKVHKISKRSENI